MGQPGSSPTVVRFGTFEVDLASAELRKAGSRVRIQEQPFQILVALIERPGEVVSREDLVGRLWPDGTYVDFDRSLNAAVARLRQVLRDSADTPRFVETVARRGYRFIAPVETGEAPNAGSFHDLRPEPLAVPAPQPRSRESAKWLGIAAAVIAVAVLAGTAISRHKPELVLQQMTRDPGLATEPAFSPDGKLLAYASDRGAQNLNIWVKQMAAGGQAVQLTHDSSDAHQPSFSPDGSRIAYRSEHDGGSIYVIPTIGGEPVKLAAEGRDPRFSPNGAWIAYWVGVESGSAPAADASGSVYVIPAGGGEPKQVGADLPPGGYPVWSTDSKNLLVYANPRIGASALSADWWMVPVSGGAARKTGAFHALQAQGFSLQFASALPRVSVWMDDAIIFSAQKGDTRNIWQVPFRTSDGTISGNAERLTNGTTSEVYASANGPLASGSIAFASLTESTAIWSLPLSSNQAAVTGDLHKLTEGDTLEVTPSISADGRTLVYGSSVPGHEDIWMKDLQTGKKMPIANAPVAEWHPVISRDGSMVAYTVDDAKAPGLFTVPATGGKSRRVGPAVAWIFDWSPDDQSIVYHLKSNDPILKRLNLQNGSESNFLQKTGVGLFQSRFSPDGKWLLFEGVTGLPSVTDSQIFIVRIQDGLPMSAENWIRIGDEHGWSDKPRWSPDGNTIYFISHRDGFRCIWAQRLDAETKHPTGAVLPIYHFHSNRLSPNHVGLSVLEIDVAVDKLVIDLGELTGNIWSLNRR
jgi:Tol biopolymer transport system component/DNA-binding winged helix-turn-helix (wHTH) protein